MSNIGQVNYRQIKLIAFCVLFFFSILLLIKCLFYPALFDEKNFLNWDAEHYNFIRTNGYDQNFRLAFFPLFPLVWKALSINVFGIVLFNALLFCLFFYFITKELKVKTYETILYLTIPSFMFFYLPYTESLFFAGSVLILSGLKKSKAYLVIIGLLICTLTRPVCTILIPALIMAEILYEPFNSKMLLRWGGYTLVLSGGLLLVGFIQHLYINEWFRFFNAQKNWGAEFRIPDFPLTSWAGGLIVRLDGAAMLVGTLSGIIVILLFLKIRRLKKIAFPKEVVFSLCYLSGITLYLLLFRGGCLNSLNRYVFATPFIIVAANFYFGIKPALTKKQLAIAFLCMTAFFLLFGSYVHIQTLLKYTVLSLYLFLLLLIPSQDKIISNSALVLFITANFFFQVFFYVRFLNGEWVG